MILSFLLFCYFLKKGDVLTWRDVLNGQITHRDKSLAGFSICCLSNSICLRLDMFASQTRDLSSNVPRRDISALRTNVIYPQFTRPCYGARMLFNKESRVGIRSIIATATTRMRVQLNTVFTTEPLPDE